MGEVIVCLNFRCCFITYKRMKWNLKWNKVDVEGICLVFFYNATPTISSPTSIPLYYKQNLN